MSDDTKVSIVPTSPVVRTPEDDSNAEPEPGVALCLSGGGYRAMLFGLGSLIRINELGLLRKLRGGFWRYHQ